MTSKENIGAELDALIEKLITETINKEMVDVRFEFEDNEQWSVVTIFDETDDSEFSLRLHSGNRYFFYHGFYDDKDEFHETVKPLGDTQVALVPGALGKIMRKVLDDEQGLRVPGTLLVR